MKNFPKDFIFGAATAAYQSEGSTNTKGKGPVAWDSYLKKQDIFSPEEASDFYNQYPVDLKLAHDFGINGIRISIAWSRIFPKGKGEKNQEGINFYHNLIDECLKNGVEPFVTLHHFDTPLALFEKGDWLNPETREAYIDFSEFCFKEYGSKVNYWITINEPWSVVAGQYIIGHFPPNIHYDIPKAIQAMHNIMVAHSKVVIKYKELNLKGQIGIVHILESKYPINEKEENALAAEKEHILANQFMLDATFNGYYSSSTKETIEKILLENEGELKTQEEDFTLMKKASTLLDFLGINYYASHFLQSYNGESLIHHNGTGEKGSSIFALKGIGERVKKEGIPSTDWDWPIYPQGLYDMMIWISEKYPNYKKIYVTENGMGAKEELNSEKTIEDFQRIEYIQLHLEAILKAIEKGVDVKGYFLWSLMDLFSWTNGFNKRYGLFFVDFKTQERFPKKSAYWFKKVKEKNSL